jgi:hypothetical protein
LWLLWKLYVWYHQHENVQRGRKKGSMKKEEINYIINLNFLFPSVHIFLSEHEEICGHWEFCLEFDAFMSHNVVVAQSFLAPCC